MERIQSAIEKARKAREGESEPGPRTMPAAIGQEAKSDSPGGGRQTGRAAGATVSGKGENWSKLREMQPQENLLRKNRLLAYEASAEAAPYDMLRTKLLHEMRKNKWRRVAITSPVAGVGKTMTSVNLGFSIGRQSDLSSMVIELDLRRPSIVRSMGLSEGCQFSEVLAGRVDAQDDMMRYGDNLAFGVNRSPARNPAELLQSVFAAQVLDGIEAAYDPDLMIFDMPPLMASDDTLAFLDQVDCALLIAEAEKTTIREVDKCEKDLATRTNVVGVMLNKCRYLDRHEKYGQYYGY